MAETPLISVAKFVFSHDNRLRRAMIALAMAGIFIDVWDLTSFSFTLASFRMAFHPGGLLLGFAVGSANIGAVVGALFGGLMTDRLGRRTMLIYNLLVFVVMAALQALSTSAVEFTAFRAVMGFGLGADVATGFTYIYEFISTAQRKEVYPLWAYAFSMTALLAVGLVLLLIHVAGYGPNTWRYPVAVGAAAALVVLIFRSRIPETPFWLARTGRYREADEVLRSIYGESPNISGSAERASGTLRPSIGAALSSGKRGVLIFSTSLNVIVGIISWGFSFYITYSLLELGLGGVTGSLYFDVPIYAAALAGGFLSSRLAFRYGTKHSATLPSFGIVASLFIALLASLGILPRVVFVPMSALTLFLEYLGPMSYNAIVNHAFGSRFRGTVNGFNYMVNKVVEALTGIAGGYVISYFHVSVDITIFLVLTLVFCIVAYTHSSNVERIDPVGLESD